MLAELITLNVNQFPDALTIPPSQSLPKTGWFFSAYPRPEEVSPTGPVLRSSPVDRGEIQTTSLVYHLSFNAAVGDLGEYHVHIQN
jgi:hypothetical protein